MGSARKGFNIGTSSFMALEMSFSEGAWILTLPEAQSCSLAWIPEKESQHDKRHKDDNTEHYPKESDDLIRLYRACSSSGVWCDYGGRQSIRDRLAETASGNGCRTFQG